MSMIMFPIPLVLPCQYGLQLTTPGLVGLMQLLDTRSTAVAGHLDFHKKRCKGQLGDCVAAGLAMLRPSLHLL